MRYIASDNKIFDSEKACLEHENRIKAEKMKKLFAEKEQRLCVIRSAYQSFLNLYEKYRENYNEPIIFGSDIGIRTDLFDRLFPLEFQ